MDQQQGASTESGSLHDGDSGDSEIASNNFGRLKVVAAVALAGISYDFGPSKITKIRIGSMESYAHYFPKGYGQPSGLESVSEPRVNKAIVFEDFLNIELRMPPHPVHTDILRRFHVQLHHLTPNAIVTISKFIWAVTSCGAIQLPTSSPSIMSYIIKTRKFILRDARLRSSRSLDASPFTQPLWRMSETCEEQVDKWLG
jgi:hypothetical protein